MNENIRDLAAKISFLVILVILLIAFLFMMRPFLFPALFAAVIVIICDPPYRVLEKWMGGRRYAASSVATLIIFLCVLVPIVVFVWIIVSNATGLVGYISNELQTGHAAEMLDKANGWISGKMEQIANFLPEGYKDFDIRGAVIGGLQSVSKIAYQYSSHVLTATAGVLSSLILLIVFIYILFAEGSQVAAMAFSLLPLSDSHKGILTHELQAAISAIFLGMIMTALAQAFLLGIGYWIAGISNPVLWAMVAVLVSLVPVIGGPLMYVPTAISLIFGGRWGAGLFLLLYGICLVSTVDNVIKPLVMKGKVNVHPVLLALSLIGGGVLAGPAGFIVGPLLVALLLSMVRTYQKEFT